MRIYVKLPMYPIEPFFHTILSLSVRRGVYIGIGAINYIKTVKRK